MVEYITIQQAPFIHDETLGRYGGLAGVRDFGLLSSALARPQAGFGDYEAYPDIFMKAAVLCHSLLKNHPFQDANKRTAVTSMGMFLESNGWVLVPARGELQKLAIAVATDQLNEAGIAAWLRDNSHPNPNA